MKRFYSFCHKCIKYTHNNYKKPYIVPNIGVVKARNESIIDTIKYNKDNDKIFSKLKNEGTKTNFKGFCGTLLRQYTKKENKEKFNNGDLDTDGKNSFYLGRHLIRNGDRAQKYTRAVDPAIEFYESNKKFFKNLDIDVPNAIIVNGGFDSNKKTLQQSMTPEIQNEYNKMPKMKTIKQFDKSLRILFRKLRIETIPTPDKRELYSQKYSKFTFSGFHYENYFLKKTKEEALPDALEVAERRWDYIEETYRNGDELDRNKLFTSTYVIGARNKREISYEVGEELTSRVVHMPEFHVELHSGCWTDPISDQIKYNGRGPIYIGNSISRHERLVNDTEGCINVIEGDVKRFDSRIWLLFKIIAVGIERCFFDLQSDLVDLHFIANYDSVGICDYYTPGGYLYRALHGLPSGVKSTSTLNSFINLLMQIFFTISFNQKCINYAIGGDDLLIITFLIFIDIREVIINNCRKIGWEFKFLYEKTFDALSYDDRPVFFKYTLDKGEPIVPPKAVFERMLIPWNKKYRNNIQILSFLNDLMPSIGAPRTHLLMFYLYYQFIYKSAFNREIKLVEVYKRHERLYKKVVNKTLKRKLNYIEEFEKVSTSIRSKTHVSNSLLNKKVFNNNILNEYFIHFNIK